MNNTPRILAFAGSLRKNSFNHSLVRIAAEASRAAGAEVTIASLRDFPMPVFDEDLEASQGSPATVQQFKKLMVEHDGFLISAPEYNSSITAVLKNTIDWVSRPVPGETPLVAFKGKVAGLMSASPGPLGGLRGLVTVRSILASIGVIVLPDQVTIAQAHAAFAEDGSLKDARHHGNVKAVGTGLAAIVAKLKA